MTVFSPLTHNSNPFRRWSGPTVPTASAVSSIRTPRSTARLGRILAALLAGVSSAAFAQAIPAASADPISVGFQMPSLLGSMQYSVSANEALTSGYYSNSGWSSSSGVSGNLALIGPNRKYPFSLVFSGGRFFSTSSQPSNSYVDLAMSQVINTRKWDFIVADTFAFLPATPSVGLGGVAGTGDLGTPPLELGVGAEQGVLTQYANRVSNAASINISRRLTGKTSLNLGGSYSLLRFLSDSGGAYDSNSYAGSLGVSHQIDQRNNLGVNYGYSRYTYLSSTPGFTSQTVSVSYSHKFSRQLSGDVQAGPQFTSAAFTTNGATSTNTGNNSIQVNTFFNADLNYAARFANYSLGYTRGTNAGYGVTPGASSDSIRFTGSRTLARVWAVSVNSAYSHTSTLAIAGAQSATPETFVVAGQASRALARSFSVYASYTLEKQSVGASAGLFDVFNGSFQVVGFGLTYSPPAKRFGNH
jgi:hypothetical protein